MAKFVCLLKALLKEFAPANVEVVPATKVG